MSVKVQIPDLLIGKSVTRNDQEIGTPSDAPWSSHAVRSRRDVGFRDSSCTSSKTKDCFIGMIWSLGWSVSMVRASLKGSGRTAPTKVVFNAVQIHSASGQRSEQPSLAPNNRWLQRHLLVNPLRVCQTESMKIFLTK